MDDKDRQLVEEVLKAAGTAGQQGFGYMVHYQIVDGITAFLGWSLVGALVVFGLKRILAWNAKEEACIAKGLGIVILSGFMFASVCGVFDGIRDAIAPEGAAIQSVLHH